MRDAKITHVYEGTNQVRRIIMAGPLLAGIQSQLHGHDRDARRKEHGTAAAATEEVAASAKVDQ